MKLVAYFDDDEVKIGTKKVGEDMHITAQYNKDEEEKTLCVLKKGKGYNKLVLELTEGNPIEKVVWLKQVVEEKETL